MEKKIPKKTINLKLKMLEFFIITSKIKSAAPGAVWMKIKNLFRTAGQVKWHEAPQQQLSATLDLTGCKIVVYKANFLHTFFFTINRGQGNRSHKRLLSYSLSLKLVNNLSLYNGEVFKAQMKLSSFAYAF